MSLLNTLIPTLRGDMVAIFGDNFSQKFELARPLKASYLLASQVMSHPIEDGTKISDHFVIDPIEIELSLLTITNDYRSIFAEIKQAWTSGDIFSIQGRAETYDNMFISAMPYEDTKAPFDSIPIVVKFREVQIVEAEYRAGPARKTIPKGTATNPADETSSQRGQVQANDAESATEDRGSLAYKIFKGDE